MEKRFTENQKKRIEAFAAYNQMLIDMDKAGDQIHTVIEHMPKKYVKKYIAAGKILRKGYQSYFTQINKMLEKKGLKWSKSGVSPIHPFIK
jgi:hypothetical protein